MSTQILSANALTRKLWSDSIFKYMLANMQLSKFMGPEGSTMPIIIKNELLSKPGDQVTFQLDMPLTGAGGYDDSDIEGNEEAMSFYNFPLQIHERSHGVRSAGKMTDKRMGLKILSRGGTALGRWAAEQVENDLCYAASGIGNQGDYVGEGSTNILTVNEKAPHANRILYGGQTAAGATEFVAADANIDSTTDNLFGSSVISVAKRNMQLAAPKFKPIRLEGGRGFYICLAHPYQIKALRAETNFKAIVQNAYDRGRNNWLFGKEGQNYEAMFDGLVGIWDDVLIYEYERVINRVAAEVFHASGDGCHSNVVDGEYRICRAIFMGAEALVMGWGQKWQRHTKDFDYNRKPGVATDALYAVSRTVWRDPAANQSTNTAQPCFACYNVDTLAVDD